MTTQAVGKAGGEQGSNVDLLWDSVSKVCKFQGAELLGF